MLMKQKKSDVKKATYIRSSKSGPITEICEKFYSMKDTSIREKCRKLSELSGVSWMTVYDYERRKYSPRLSFLLAICPKNRDLCEIVKIFIKK